MLPSVYEFRWDAGHVVFLGVFLLVLSVVVTTFVLALRRSGRDVALGRVAAIRWHAQFDDQPAASRTCRHALTGRTPSRTCERGFDCCSCPDYQRLSALAPAAGDIDASGTVDVLGLKFPLDRFYDRGHTWVRRQGCGRVRIGLDAFATRVVGEPEAVQLPPPGTRLHAHDTAWRMWKQGTELRIVSPVDGVVRATGGPGRGWYLDVEAEPDAHLLREAEVRPWAAHEAERLLCSLAPFAAPGFLQDGGTLTDDPVAALPECERGPVRDALLLQG